MTFRTRRWSELSPGQQRWVAGLAAAEVVLTARSLIDLARRPAPEIRGSKALWVPAMFVQPIGPIAYLLWGRRTG